MRDKIYGVVYGTAIGDALGWPVEFNSTVTPSNPKVTKDAVPRRFTDDTQMFRAVLEGMLRWSSGDVLVEQLHADKHAIDAAAEEVAEEFITWSKSPDNDRAPGGSCMAGCRNLERGKPWREAGVDSGGCGTAMRSQAYGLWFYEDSEHAARWAAEHARMTHNHPMAQAAAAAVAAGTAAAIRGGPPARVLEPMLTAADAWDMQTNEMLCDAAQSRKESADTILDRWRGWAGYEAVAASLWCFLRHPNDFERAVLTAVNSPGDSDSLGAITGALVGGRVGISGIPKRWVQQVEDSAGLEVLASRVCKRLGL